MKTINEVRAEQGLAPVQGGDAPLVQSGGSLVPLAQAAKGPSSPTSPSPLAGEGRGEGSKSTVAKYAPDQPRVPSGQSGGGRFISGDGGGDPSTTTVTAGTHEADPHADQRQRPIQLADGAQVMSDVTSGKSNLIDDTPLLTPVSQFKSQTPVPFVDRSGNPILDRDGNPMQRPSDVDPSLFVDLGRATASDPTGASSLAGLGSFSRGGSLDVQRVGPDGAYVGKFTNFANVAIGLYASAAEIPESVTLWIANMAGRTSQFSPDATMDPTYSNLRVENIYDIKLGYRLYQSGRIEPSQNK